MAVYVPRARLEAENKTTMMQGRPLPSVPGEEVDFLLPTGLMVTLKASATSTLRQLKDQLYQEAKQYPLFSFLKDQGFYNFLGKFNASCTLS